MVAAVANATVPKYTVLIGGSYGAGNYGMCGRGFNPRMLFAWPNVASPRWRPIPPRRCWSTSVAGMRCRDDRRGDRRAAGRDPWPIRTVDPYYATGHLWDDGLIDPVDTRDALGLCLAVGARQPEPEAGPGLVYRM